VLASHCRSSGSIPGDIHVGQGRFAAVISSKFLLFLPANHQCTTTETCDTSDQAEHYHILGLKLGVSSLTWNLSGYRVRKLTFIYLLSV
jgi:hypothetical protein